MAVSIAPTHNLEFIDCYIFWYDTELEIPFYNYV